MYSSLWAVIAAFAVRAAVKTFTTSEGGVWI